MLSLSHTHYISLNSGCNDMRFWRYDNRLRKWHGIKVYGIKQSNRVFFGWTNVWKHVFIQMSLIKNNQVNVIIDYILG